MADGEAPEVFVAGLAEGFRATLAPPTRVLLAVSGGADSTAMMVGAAELGQALGVSFAVGCVDHGLREGSAEEAGQVVARALALGMPARAIRVALGHGAGLEARARTARYEALEALRAELGCDLIATAHTREDQAETLLMRLSRGAALRGAAGIRRSAGRVVRPMLKLSRLDARAFLRERGVDWVEDAMNADPSFFRVRIRRSVLPALEAAATASVAGHLAHFAELAAEDDAYLEGLAGAAWTRLSTSEGLDVTGLRALAPPLRRRIWVRWLEEAGLAPSADRVRTAEALLEEGARQELVRGKILDARGGWLRWEGIPAPAPTGQALRSVGEVIGFGAQTVGVAEVRPLTGWSIAIPRSALPLQVRSRRPGDRVLVRGHHRKLQDVLVDAKVPREKRDQVPVICTGDGVPTWVAGLFEVGPPLPPAPGIWLWTRPS